MSGGTVERTVVDGRREHAPFLAWVMQAASRSHLERGALEIFVDGSDPECLRFLEGLVLTTVPQWSNFQHFLVAERNGQPAGALCGYFAEECDGPLFGKSTVDVAVQLGWTHDRLVAAWNRLIPLRSAPLGRTPGAWQVESVATLPAFRRMGVVRELLEAILARGRQRGATVAEISALIGNDGAQRAYESAGFAVVEEARHPDYEAAFGCAGQRLLRRPL